MRLYAITIFIGAFLLFLVQPMSARYLTPVFGGSAVIWGICLAFFQVLLLAGYFYAFNLNKALRRHKVKTSRRFHFFMIGMSCLAVVYGLIHRDIHMSANMAIEWQILYGLLVTVGLPYFLLATTNPLLQSWCLNRFPEKESKVYHLYALSNLGSLLGLLCYPIIMEPFFSLKDQNFIWSVGFIIYALCLLWLTQSVKPLSSVTGETRTAPIGIGRYAIWLGLSAVPSGLLIAITHYLTQNIAPIPLFWVVPLTLYLLSFIWAFSLRHEIGPRHFFLTSAAFMLMLCALFPQKASYYINGFNGTFGLFYSVSFAFGMLIMMLLAGFFAIGLHCHRTLSQLKPPADQLTRFYLVIALGGALGGLFVALLSPAIFNDYWELPILMAIALIMIWMGYMDWCRGRAQGRFAYFLIGTLVMSLALIGFIKLQSATLLQDSATVMRVRNIYAALKIKEDDFQGHKIKILTNGNVTHGFEYVDAALPRKTGYYDPSSGVGRSLTYLHRQQPQSQHVGIIGLGIGTLAAYARPGDLFTFYEINPLVISLAHQQFSYLAKSPARTEILLGDARQTLERQPNQQFDILVVDAFSSDAIPIHLLTQEAFALYNRHLKPDSLLVIHISNQYINLQPITAAAAESLGMHALNVNNQKPETPNGYASNYVILSRKDLTNEPEFLSQDKDIKITPLTYSHSGVSLWTDQFSSIFPLLNWELVLGLPKKRDVKLENSGI